MDDYKRYRLSYPYKTPKTYKSKSLSKAVKECYKEFRSINDIKDGMFSVTDLDDNIEYQFRAKNNRIYKSKDQAGGSDSWMRKLT